MRFFSTFMFSPCASQHRVRSLILFLSELRSSRKREKRLCFQEDRSKVSLQAFPVQLAARLLSLTLPTLLLLLCYFFSPKTRSSSLVSQQCLSSKRTRHCRHNAQDNMNMCSFVGTFNDSETGASPYLVEDDLRQKGISPEVSPSHRLGA